MFEPDDRNIADIAQALPSMPSHSDTGNTRGTVISNDGDIITLGEDSSR